MKKRINLLYYYYPVLSPKTPLDRRPLFLENALDCIEGSLMSISHPRINCNVINKQSDLKWQVGVLRSAVPELARHL